MSIIITTKLEIETCCHPFEEVILGYVLDGKKLVITDSNGKFRFLYHIFDPVNNHLIECQSVEYLHFCPFCGEAINYKEV